MRKKDEEWAVFWCALLRPALFDEVGPEETNQFLKKLSKQEVVLPNGKRRRPSLSTLRRKYRKYRKEGFEALARQARSDRGKIRKLGPEALARAVYLKRDQPARSHDTINQILKSERDLEIPRSTLYRHLRDAGATRIKLGLTGKKVRKRWSQEHTQDMWVGDFMEGPYVVKDGQVVPTQLSGFIDCHSRYVVAARYYYRQTLDVLIDTLLRAWAIHGSSLALYLDNAKVYHSLGLNSACYRLKIRLLHRQAGDPAGGGLIERFFGTVQQQFETEVRAGEILTLEQLNKSFLAWLEMRYHRRPHSETGQTPEERYRQGLTVLRRVDMTEAALSFMRREHRIVHKDFSDIQLNGGCYRVDPKLRGDKVEVRYDPFSSLETVLIYSLRGEYLGKGVRHQREEGQEVAPASSGKAKYNYLELLVRQYESACEKKVQGIDYHRLAQRQGWSFPAFVNTFARLSGRKGGLGAFSAGELEQLKKLYNRDASLNEALVKKAFEEAGEADFLTVVYRLQNLLERKES